MILGSYQTIGPQGEEPQGMVKPGSWKKIEERKQLKIKMLSTKSSRQQVQEGYKGKDKEVKKSARNDKRSFVEGLAAEAKCAAGRGEQSTVYKTTKRLW